jgi:predicted NBD/HSP70 family sugar kinase
MGEDPRAMALLDRVSRAIAGVVRAVAAAYGVRLVAMGGGVVAALPLLLERVRELVGEDGAPVVAACFLGDDAGVIGAGVRSLRGG